MKLLDLAGNAHLASLNELLTTLGHAADPRDVLRELIASAPHNGHPHACAEISTLDDSAGQYTIQRLTDENGTDLLPQIRRDGSIVCAGGFLEQMIRTPLPKIARELELENDPILPNCMAPYRSAMAVPVFVGQSNNDWLVLFDRRESAFDAVELGEMLLRASLVGSMLNNLQVARRLFDANLKVQREITNIAAIQKALLPQSLPQIPNLRLAASYEPAFQTGGDIYDFVPLIGGEQRWAILVGDVAGHGPAAAVVMAMLNCLLHTGPRDADGPGQILSYINRHLCAKHIGGTFATAVLAIYEPATRQFTYCRAGHCPPLLLSPGSSLATPLEAVGDEPLGLVADANYSQASITLAPGQLVLLYTDGITEARDPQNRFFETHGLLEALTGGELSPERVIRRLKAAILHHTGSPQAEDDQTLLAIQAE